MDPIKIVISSCLLGKRVRYDGRHKLDRYLKDTLGKSVKWVGICPETGCGLPVPRECMRLSGSCRAPRLIAEDTGKDRTGMMMKWIERELPRLRRSGISGFVLKSRSPSCGVKNVRLYSPNGRVTRKGTGLFARAVIDAFPDMPVLQENSPRPALNKLSRQGRV